MVVEHDETLGRQIAQRLADRCGADIEPVRNLGLDQPGAAGQVAAQNRTTQGLTYELVRGHVIALPDLDVRERFVQCLDLSEMGRRLVGRSHRTHDPDLAK